MRTSKPLGLALKQTPPLTKHSPYLRYGLWDADTEALTSALKDCHWAGTLTVSNSKARQVHAVVDAGVSPLPLCPG